MVNKIITDLLNFNIILYFAKKSVCKKHCLYNVNDIVHTNASLCRLFTVIITRGRRFKGLHRVFPGNRIVFKKSQSFKFLQNNLFCYTIVLYKLGILRIFYKHLCRLNYMAKMTTAFD